MSIGAEIIHRIAEGRLHEFLPIMPSPNNKRRLLVTTEVQQIVDGPWSNSALSRRCGRARGWLEQFVHGDEIVARMPPSKNVNTLLALLAPAVENVWEFRIGDPRPGIRIFGRFADLDVFVATNWGKREDLDMQSPAKKSEWQNEMVRCKTKWRNLFPTYNPLSGDTLHDYISNARLPL